MNQAPKPDVRCGNEKIVARQVFRRVRGLVGIDERIMKVVDLLNRWSNADDGSAGGDQLVGALVNGFRDRDEHVLHPDLAGSRDQKAQSPGLDQTDQARRLRVGQGPRYRGRFFAGPRVTRDIGERRPSVVKDDHCDEGLASRRNAERRRPGVYFVWGTVMVLDDVGDQSAVGLVFEEILLAFCLLYT